MVIHLDGPMYPDLLAKAVTHATHAEPVTRCHLLRIHDSLYWEMNPDFRENNLVILLSAPEPRTMLHQALSYPIDPFHGPMIRVVLIQNRDPDGGDILVINAHHTSMDGRGLKDFTGLVIASYKALRDGYQNYTPPAPISQRQVPKILTLAQAGNRIIPSDLSEAWFAEASVPMKSRKAGKEQYSLLTLPAARMKVIQATRKEWGVTMNDLMAGVVSQVFSSFITEGSDPVVPLLITLDLRRYLEEVPARSVMNFSTAFEVRVPVKPGESLSGTVSSVHTMMNRIKEGAPGIDGAREAERMYDEGYRAATTEMQNRWNEIRNSGRKTTLFSNTGIISIESIDPGVPMVTHAYLLPTHSLPPGFFLAFSTCGDLMTISATYYVPAYDQTLIDKIFSQIDRILPGYEQFPGRYTTV